MPQRPCAVIPVPNPTPLPPAILDEALARVQEGVLVYGRDGTLVHANPAAQVLYRSHPLYSGAAPRIEDLLPPHAVPQAREQGRWNDYLPFGEGRVLAAWLDVLPDGEHTLLLLQDPGLVRDSDQELLRPGERPHPPCRAPSPARGRGRVLLSATRAPRRPPPAR